MNTTIEQTIGRIAADAESIKSDAERAVMNMEIGDECRQGDIYITRIACVPNFAKRVKNPSAQLAPGNTQGSRHTIRSMSGVKVYELDSRCINVSPLDGPIIEAETEFAVDHPEHGNRIFQPGCYAVTYQRAFAEEIRRVQD